MMLFRNTADELYERAAATEQLAAMVSFNPDKEQLRRQAAELRQEAARAAQEPRSFERL